MLWTTSSDRTSDVGVIYSLYQWKHDVASKDLIDILPLSEMERLFPVLHQAGWDVAVDKIHNAVCEPQVASD